MLIPSRPMWILIGVVGLLCASAGAQNIFPDPGFEASGEEGVCHSGERAGHVSVGEKQHWAAINRRLTVEPFATYQASGWVKARVTSGTLTALHGYVYEAMQWSFGCGVGVKGTFDWREVKTAFISPYDFYEFAALAFYGAADSEAWVDDVVVEEIKSAEETMQALLAKEKPSGVEHRLITRYLLSQGEIDKVRQMAEGFSGSLRADTFCVLAAKVEAPEEKLRCIKAAIEAGTLGQGMGPTTIARLLKGFSAEDSLAAYEVGAKLKVGSRDANRANVAMAGIHLDMARGASTCQQAGELLGKAREAAEGASKEGEDILAKITAEAERLAERQEALGNCTITIGGQKVTPYAYTIVTSGEASRCELYAAQELQKYLEMITGQALPLRSESEDVTGGMILVGAGERTKQLGVEVDLEDLGDEGLLIRTVGPHLVIAGGRARGTLYGVYSLLEEYLGCGWFRPGPLGEVVPREGAFSLADVNLVQKPVFEWRNMSGTGDGAWMVHNKLDPTMGGDSYGAERGDPAVFGSGGHAFDYLLRPADYFVSHPEYFALVNGKRIWHGGQICTSNPEVIKICAQSLIDQMKARPNCKIFSICQDDGYGWCECEKCRALDVKPELMTDRLITFVNAVGEIVEKECPDRFIYTYAYTQKNTEPPFNVKPRRNVVIQITHYSPCCHGHPIATCPKNATFKRQIEGWTSISRLYVYDYRVDYSHYLMPYPTSYAIKEDVPYYRDIGVKGIFYQGGASDAQHGICQYLIAKLMWDPDMPFEEILDRWFGRYFEAAGPAMRRYFHLLHDPIRDKDIHINLYSAPPKDLFTPEFFEQADACFEEALRVAPNDLARRRVELERLSLCYVKLATLKQTRPMRVEGDQLKIEAARGGSWRQDLADFIRIAKENRVFNVRENTSTPKYVDGYVEKVLGMRVHNDSEWRYLEGEEARTGGRCVYIRGAVKGSHSGWSQSGLILKPRTEYAVSAWVKVTGTEETEVTAARVTGSGVSTGVKLKAAEGWQRVEVSFVTPDSPSISVTLHPALLTNEGEVWIDDVALVAAEDPDNNLVGNGSFEKARGTMPDGWRCPVKRDFRWTELPPVSEFLKDPEGFPVAAAQNHSYRIVALENSLLRAEVVPALGGRILRLIDKRTGRNFTYVPSQLEMSGGWRNYGGYEEYSGNAFASPGWEEPYECKASTAKGGERLVLSANLTDGFRLVRELSLRDGEPELRVKSVLTNASNAEITTRLRVHPIFALHGKAADHALIWKGAGGKLQRMNLGEFAGDKWLQGADLPKGLWGVVNETRGEALVNTFDPQQVGTCYLCSADAGTVNLELMSRDVTLAPGESITLEHSYRLVKDLKEEWNW